MFYTKLFRSNIFSTLFLLFLTVFSSNANADFYLINRDVSNYSDCYQDALQDLINRTEDVETPRKYGISCFKLSIDQDAQNQEVLIAVYQIYEFKPLTNLDDLNHIFRAEIEAVGVDYKLLKPIQIKKAGDLFPKENALQQKEAISIEEFVEFITNKNIDFKKLVQANLKRPYEESNPTCGGTSKYHNGFYTGKIDGDFRKGSIKALTALIDHCGKEAITADMIASVLLPQLFAFEPATQNITKEQNNNYPMVQNERKGNSASTVGDNLDEGHFTTDGDDQLDGDGNREKNSNTGTAENTNLEVIENLANAKNRIEELEKELQSARNKITSISNEREKLREKQLTQTIFEKWAELPISVRGILPDTPPEIALIKGTPNTCRLSASKTLLDSALDAYSNGTCFEYSFSIGDVDPSKKFVTKKLPNGKYHITFQLRPDQVETLTSVKTEKIDGFQENLSCMIELTFVKNSKIVNSFPPNQEVGLFPSWDAEGYYLSDYGMKQEKIMHNGLRVKLTTPDLSGQKCQLTAPVDVPIVYENIYTKGSPQAYVNRDGELLLSNLPLELIKGELLVVFLDTNVGYEDQPEIAFNTALGNKKSKSRQALYFSGFVNALSEYLSSQSKFDNIIIYDAVSAEEGKKSETLDDFEIILSKDNIKDQSVKADLLNFLDDVKVNFDAGNRGSFNDKRDVIKNLEQQKSLVKFLSFGPSGLTEDRACDVKRGFESNFMIFDIWPRDTVDDLLLSDKITKIEETLAYSCEGSNQFYGLKDSPSTTKDIEISGPVYKYLDKFLEN